MYITFRHSIHFKVIGLSSIEHLETIDSLSYAELPKADTFQNQVITFINIITDFIINFLSIGMLSSFPDSHFHLKAGILLLAINTLDCFPWSDSFILFTLERGSAKCPYLINHRFHVKKELHQKQMVRLTVQIIAWFSWSQNCNYWFKDFMRISHFFTQVNI